MQLCGECVCDCCSWGWGGGKEREKKIPLSLSLSLETTHCLLLPPSSILAPLRQNLFTVILLPEEGEKEEGFQKPLDGLLPFLPRGRGGGNEKSLQSGWLIHKKKPHQVGLFLSLAKKN